MTVVVVGAGWSGAVAARELHDAGRRVEVFEREPAAGGHARCEVLNGVVYEPNGAHIFHTSNRRVADYVARFGMSRPFEHRVLAEVYLKADDEKPVLLSWPPQLSELRALPLWSRIESELGSRPTEPNGDDFETWVTSLMGRSLYEMFVEGYTRKQWGCEPSELSSRFAPRRVELRDDGNTRLFRDRWEFFPPTGAASVIETILQPVPVTCGVTLDADGVLDATAKVEAVVVTAPLDDFANAPTTLPWRGIQMVSRYQPVDQVGDTVTPAYVVNHPSPRVPFTRTVETKHATQQQIAGTVVSEEHPGAPTRHYPVPTLTREGERRNQELQEEIVRRLAPTPVFFCGRLAEYRYINQDEAVAGALVTAKRVLAGLR